MERMKETPLHGEHRKRAALMAPFGGWEMPIQYEGILAEHRWCRESAALFDVCHMGEFYFQGDLDTSGFDRLFTFSVKSIPVGRSRYGFLLNRNGGIIDDLIVFRLAENEVMVVVNAATSENDFAVMSQRLQGGDFHDGSSETGKLDLQGPLSRQVLTALAGERIASIPYFRFLKMKVAGIEATVSRTGYTGELGYEIFLPADRVEELWRLILANGRVKPAGLGARDVLRLEMGYSLYGSDIDEMTTPIEAALEAFVDFSKDFVGKEALLHQQRQGLVRRKIGFRVNSRRSPRHDYSIIAEGEGVGKVTSGVFSPMLGCGIGIGYVEPRIATVGARLTVQHEKVSMEGEIVDLPFYTGGSVRS